MAETYDVNISAQLQRTVDKNKKVIAVADDRSQGQVLSDFLTQLEDYTPTIPDAVTSYYCQSAGFEASDPRIVRLISIAAQKFISDVANDALQHCKTRTNNTPVSHGTAKNVKTPNTKDRKYTLTMEDLSPALNDYGITVRKAHYFVWTDDEYILDGRQWPSMADLARYIFK